MYRVVLVDDQQIFRDILRDMLEAAGGFEIVGEAIDGLEAVNLFQSLRPDLVLMDVQMGRMNGFESTARIRELDPQAAVVLTSMRQDPEYASIASQSGALAFFPKRDLDIEIVRSLLDEHTINAMGRQEAA